jgi:hypothetical protein
MRDPVNEISREDYLGSTALFHFVLLHFLRIIVETSDWVASFRRAT